VVCSSISVFCVSYFILWCDWFFLTIKLILTLFRSSWSKSCDWFRIGTRPSTNILTIGTMGNMTVCSGPLLGPRPYLAHTSLLPSAVAAVLTSSTNNQLGKIVVTHWILFSKFLLTSTVRLSHTNKQKKTWSSNGNSWWITYCTSPVSAVLEFKIVAVKVTSKKGINKPKVYIKT
jgi:hypothetical protein